jgi:hypothetical protein
MLAAASVIQTYFMPLSPDQPLSGILADDPGTVDSPG